MHAGLVFLLLPLTSAFVPTRAPRNHLQRTRTPFAQLPEWTSHVDEVSGATYYYNTQTGQSEWELPQAALYQSRLVCKLR